MLDRLMTFLRDLPGGPRQVPRPAADDPRVAAAALMIHVMDADGTRQRKERDRLRAVVEAEYGVAGEELDRILAAGEEADRDAIDLHAFTSVLDRHLDAPARRDFVRILWELVYADGDLHELEDNVVWRIAELIGVEGRDRVALRQRVERAARERGKGGSAG